MIFLQVICYLAAAFSFVESKGNSPPAKDWQSYKAFYRKIYVNSVSESKHQQNFEKNLQRIEAHNAKYEAGNTTYTLELNKYSDQDPTTFSKTMNGYVQLKDSNATVAPVVSGIGSMAASFDWRSQGKVSPVKDQKSCGSCWAFSTTGALESQMLIKGKGSKTLSEQQLVDCDKRNNGCNGGHYLTAFDYIKQNGIQSDGDYSYKAARGSCKFSNSKVVTRVSGSNRVPNDANQVMQTLQKVGPLAIAVDASEIMQYSSGVLTCSKTNLNHAVLLVGFGSDNGNDYWIVKNSWGTGWGDKGYIKISRRSGRDCGVTRDVAYATI